MTARGTTVTHFVRQLFIDVHNLLDRLCNLNLLRFMSFYFRRVLNRHVRDLFGVTNDGEGGISIYLNFLLHVLLTGLSRLVGFGKQVILRGIRTTTVGRSIPGDQLQRGQDSNLHNVIRFRHSVTRLSTDDRHHLVYGVPLILADVIFLCDGATVVRFHNQ